MFWMYLSFCCLRLLFLSSFGFFFLLYANLRNIIKQFSDSLCGTFAQHICLGKYICPKGLKTKEVCRMLFQLHSNWQLMWRWKLGPSPWIFSSSVCSKAGWIGGFFELWKELPIHLCYARGCRHFSRTTTTECLNFTSVLFHPRTSHQDNWGRQNWLKFKYQWRYYNGRRSW